MKLSAPTRPIFLMSMILAVLGILPILGVVMPVVGAYATFFLIGAYVPLALAVMLKGL
jgi:hypothetical protein